MFASMTYRSPSSPIGSRPSSSRHSFALITPFRRRTWFAAARDCASPRVSGFRSISIHFVEESPKHFHSTSSWIRFGPDAEAVVHDLDVERLEVRPGRATEVADERRRDAEETADVDDAVLPGLDALALRGVGLDRRVGHAGREDDRLVRPRRALARGLEVLLERLVVAASVIGPVRVSVPPSTVLFA